MRAIPVTQIALTWARLVTDVAPHGEMAVGAVIVTGEESILARQSNLAVILPISGRMS